MTPPIPTTPPTSAIAATLPHPTRPRRASRFTEGPPVTGDEVAQQPPSNHDLLRSFLLQQDELEERKRKARSDSSASSASTESFASAFRRHTSAAYGGPSPSPGPLDGVVPEKHVGRRSIVFGRPSSDGARRSLDERPREVGAESVATKFKGRLRALTGGRERSVKPYPGT
ncbi:hypothetical protein QTJ16_002639 [Diplocarpon rosae]|uniref:Uncharacterized protein n=1 Tax=Diplocarpon rosae TaxID=946125 RepID=A0AAD9WF76_9HELO|nr:hypothetical protein QTJ16_002639 [Diplocarpon rosae]